MNFKPALLAAALAGLAASALADPAVIYDMGGKFDKSFNQAAFDGAERWKKETGKSYLDVRHDAEWKVLVDDVVARHGKLDILVHSAGIAGKNAPLDEYDLDEWHRVIDIDLNGAFYVNRAVLPGMKARKKGAIVALSSIMGVAYGWDEHVHYSAAKSGVVGLVRGLAVELARDGIRVNGVAPGYIRTAQLLSKEHSLGPDADKAGAFIPMGRIGEPEDIADVILFLGSKGARYMTGQVVVVDGGLLVGRY